MRANYAGNVSLIDDMVGEILYIIDSRGELDNTVIAFVSDHGEMNGDYGLIYKSNFLESSARVPFLLRTPASAAAALECDGKGVTCDSPIEWFDLGPTLVELAGGEIGQRQFAMSRMGCLDDPDTRIRDESICEMRGEIMLREEKWKLAINQAGQPFLLFDLENDPCESRNLAGLEDYRDIETELRLRILERVVAAQLG